MVTGWRKYYSQVLDNTFLMNDNNAYLIFMKLLAAVNNKGEYSGTGREMALLFNLKYPTAYKALLRLQQQRIINIFTTPRGRVTIIKLVNFAKYQSRQQMSKQESKQADMQQLTDEELIPSKQPSKQESIQSVSSGEAERPKLQGSKNELDKDKEYNYKGFVIFGVQLLEEIKAFVDYRVKKDKGFTQYALDRNLTKLKKLYPDDIEMQRECINESIARGWSGIFELKESKQTAAAEGWF